MSFKANEVEKVSTVQVRLKGVLKIDTPPHLELKCAALSACDHSLVLHVVHQDGVLIHSAIDTLQVDG